MDTTASQPVSLDMIASQRVRLDMTISHHLTRLGRRARNLSAECD